MNLIWFQRNPLPVDWEAQRQIVSGFFVAAGIQSPPIQELPTTTDRL